MKIILFGTTDIAAPVLLSLHKEHDVLSVVTAPDAPSGRKKIPRPSAIAKLGSELGIPILKFSSLASLETERTLSVFNPEIFVVGSYGKIIPKALLEIPKHGAINVHPSLLPKYRGPSPIPSSILAGDKMTGTTLIVMDDEMDHGPILAQRKIPIEGHDTFITLANKLWTASADLLIEVLPKYARGELIPKDQDHKSASFTKLISKNDGRIDWKEPAQKIYDRLRAYTPWPGIWATWNSQSLKILAAEVTGSSTDQPPGTVLNDGFIASGNGSVLGVKKLQLSGKKETDIKSFINGYRNFIGSQLA